MVLRTGCKLWLTQQNAKLLFKRKENFENRKKFCGLFKSFFRFTSDFKEIILLL